ncbi:FAD-binding monooxygenase [Phyllobacterium phragmitis]|uniref:FAD-binding monooxygenase n=1 Tax=Phyllobacterium phragmitis TaxID=2670329 RepID=A0A2S9IIY8_9HYPH|nr:FAD-dependent monooxygenase [Phyllobacterium phragmitis]PRD40494.1 FAD-binding monooxygenase [Phyllobacterium phragmitis]
MQEKIDDTDIRPMSLLVSGASFAGLSTAYWMNRLGYQVTVVEVAQGLRKGGTPVDIRDRTIGIVARMGLLDEIRARRLPPRPTIFKNADDEIEGRLPPQSADEEEYEIERDVLLGMLFKAIEGRVEILFGNSIVKLTETQQGVRTSFADGSERTFSLVIGCDGNHSVVRRMSFGDEATYSHFLGAYFSVSVVDKLMIGQNTTQVFSTPGKSVILNAYDSKTDIVLGFRSDNELAYDHRDQAQQKRIIHEQFTGIGWKVPALLAEIEDADNFYFDKLCQIRMPCWTSGRFALVGDAAYCASPAAGMGGSLAIIGAAALADAFEMHPGNFAFAFEAYNDGLRTFIDETQMQAVDFGLEIFFPKTEESIRRRMEQLPVT